MASDDNNAKKESVSEMEKLMTSVQKIEKDLTDELKKHIEKVDTDMVSLATSIDQLHEKVMNISQDVVKDIPSTNSDNELDVKGFVAKTHDENMSQQVKSVKLIKSVDTNMVSLAKSVDLLHDKVMNNTQDKAITSTNSDNELDVKGLVAKTHDENMSQQVKSVSVDTESDKSIDQFHQDAEKATPSTNSGNEMDVQEFVAKTPEHTSQLVKSVKYIKTMKTNMIQSLSKLLHFLYVDSEEICTNKLPDKCKPKIDSYFLHDKSTSEVVDVWIEMIQEENKRLRERNKLYREHAALVNKRENLVSDERDRLRKELNELYQNIAQNTSDFKMIGNSFVNSIKSDVSGQQQTVLASLNTESDSTGIEAIQKKMIETKKSLDEAQEHIRKLEESLKKTQQELRDNAILLKSVCLQSRFEVDIMHTTYETDWRGIENGLITILKMYAVDCNDITGHSTRKETSSHMVFMLCCGHTPESWDNKLKTAKQTFPANASIVIVMIYNKSSKNGANNCKDAQLQHGEFLSKASEVLDIGYYTGKNDSFSFSKEDVARTIAYIKQRIARKTKVVGCYKCTKPS